MFVIQISYMFWPYILAIFRKQQVWLMCTAYMATCHRQPADYTRIAHLRQECHNSKFMIFQEKLLKVLKCYNFLWVQWWHSCSSTASFANCVDTTPVKSASANISFYTNNSKIPNFELTPLSQMSNIYNNVIRIKWWLSLCKSSSDVAIKIWSSAYTRMYPEFPGQ